MQHGKKNFVFIATIAVVISAPAAFLLYKAGPGRPETEQRQETAAADRDYARYLNLGRDYLERNLPEQSLAPLEKARAINPRSAAAHNNLGVAFILLKRFDEGIAACRRALELDPEFQLAKNNLAWGQAEKEQFGKK